jgi:hypothetical protein
MRIGVITSPTRNPDAGETWASRPMRCLRKFLELSPDDQRLLLKLWSLLVFVAVLLRLLDYQRTLCLLSRWMPAVPENNAVSEEAMSYAMRLGRLARIAGRYVPANGSCLRQSLLVWWLLRRRRVPAALRIGVRTQGGFAAHAWVNLDGQPVNDSDGIERRFAAFDPLH